MIVFLQGEFIENLEQGQHTIEPWLCRGDARYLSVEPHDCRQLKGDATLGIVEEGAQTAQLVLLQELFAEQVWWELDCYLVDGVACAVVLEIRFL